jgi:hypothetical protein
LNTSKKLLSIGTQLPRALHAVVLGHCQGPVIPAKVDFTAL